LLLLLYFGCTTISFICWFRVIRFHFCVFRSLHSRRSWWRRRCHNSWCTDILRGLSERVTEIYPVHLWGFFSGKTQNSGPGTTLLKCRPIRNFGLLDMRLKTFCCTCSHICTHQQTVCNLNYSLQLFWVFREFVTSNNSLNVRDSILLEHFARWRWGYYVASQHLDPLTQWRSIISQENKIPSYTAAKTSTLITCMLWI
jgi:hypothetical protein